MTDDNDVPLNDATGNANGSSALARACWCAERASKVLCVAMLYDTDGGDPDLTQLARYLQLAKDELGKCDLAMRDVQMPAVRSLWDDAEDKLLVAKCCASLLAAIDWEKPGSLSTDGTYLFSVTLDALNVSLENLWAVANGYRPAHDRPGAQLAH